MGLSPAELDADIQAAQAELVQAGQAPAIKRDPTLRLFLATQARVIGVLGAAVGQLRQPLSDGDLEIVTGAVLTSINRIGAEVAADVEKGAHAAMRKEAARMLRTFDRALVVKVGLAIGAAFVAGGLVTVAALHQAAAGPFTTEAQAARVWSELHRCNPFPQNARPVQNSGRAVVTLWMTCDQQPGDTR